MRPFVTHLKHSLRLTLALTGVLSLLFTPATLNREGATPAHRPAPPAPERATDDRARETLEAYGQTPLTFERNLGQTASEVDYLARGAGYTLFLKPSEAVLRLRDETAPASSVGAEIIPPPVTRTPHSAVLRMKLVGADESASGAGADESAGKVNYFNGSDPSAWRTNVPAFGRVRYSEVYPGVDVVYYGNQRQLEYDFVVAPGADAQAVTLRFDGADEVKLDASSGDLLLGVGDATVRQPKPFVYQEVAGTRRAVEGGYVLEEGGHVRFALGAYDSTLPLVIDPVLVYSTYIGGSGGDQGLHIALDSSNNAYVVGLTTSTNFPTANPIQAANGGIVGSLDAFVTKLNAAGNALVYSTYLGGDGNDQGRGIAVDSSGNAYVTGVTNSTNFPTANAFDSTIGGNGDDAFVTKLNAAGNALVYSTYLGGDDSAEFGQAITVDSSGNAYVTGNTFSNDFPTVNPIQATEGGGSTRRLPVED